MAPEETLDALENSWSVMGSNLTWKLQKSLRHPEIPRESGDVTQASTSGEAEFTSPTEGTVVAPLQIVTCDALAMPDTPGNMSGHADLVQSDSTLCESEANLIANPHRETSLASLGETDGVTHDETDVAHDPQCEPASASAAHFWCPQGYQKCA